MKQILLSLLLVIVVGASSLLGWEWVQMQAYLVYSRYYVQEVSDLGDLWNSQQNYPQGRHWLHEFYYQRRWEILGDWAKVLIQYNQKLHLQGEFIQSIKNFVQVNSDYRDSEKLKFYVLELKDRMKRLPRSQISKYGSLFLLVSPKLSIARSLLEENKKLVSRMVPKIQQLEGVLQAQGAIDTNNYCSAQKALMNRQNILDQMKQKCAEPANSKLPMCLRGANYFQAEIDHLQQLDQTTMARIRRNSLQWREPACTP